MSLEERLEHELLLAYLADLTQDFYDLQELAGALHGQANYTGFLIRRLELVGSSLSWLASAMDPLTLAGKGISALVKRLRRQRSRRPPRQAPPSSWETFKTRALSHADDALYAGKQIARIALAEDRAAATKSASGGAAYRYREQLLSPLPSDVSGEVKRQAEQAKLWLQTQGLSASLADASGLGAVLPAAAAASFAYQQVSAQRIAELKLQMYRLIKEAQAASREAEQAAQRIARACESLQRR